MSIKRSIVAQDVLVAAKKLLAGDYRQIGDLAGTDNCESEWSEVAETIAMLAVKLEAREYSLQQTLQKLDEKNIQLTAALSERNERLDAALQTIKYNERLAIIGRLAASVAHEINTPLAVLLATCNDLLQDGGLFMRDLLHLLQSVNEGHKKLFVAIISEVLKPDWQRPALKQERNERLLIQGVLSGQAISAEFCEFFSTALAKLGWTATKVARWREYINDDSAIIIKCANGICDRRSGLQNINVAARQIDVIVQSLKNYSGFSNREFQITNLLKTLDMALALCQGLRKYAVEIELSCDNSLWVNGQQEMLIQVWLNLLLNALQATGDKGEVIVNGEKEGDHAIVTFIDNGPGIATDIASKIFQPFFTTKSRGEGSGLGLDVCRQIVVAHHGNIEFTSRPGQTIFRVSLPLVDNGEC